MTNAGIGSTTTKLSYVKVKGTKDGFRIIETFGLQNLRKQSSNNEEEEEECKSAFDQKPVYERKIFNYTKPFVYDLGSGNIKKDFKESDMKGYQSKRSKSMIDDSL
eukprot:CAMPEP_0114587780 /NCGR_PEP_ID=MMETSP0125-20121206/10657_1 /TAXON_ID=485358 ORGANISM="Aristerostoma sp., Strain ATCC 50986" /NCGR_SAMPLE_ID=MMETSP0125 /ASSEMBLY_ACC=CAM_ASM_000245 /LENGTH=105 /DNA_ID=CAMNT_0001783867 /DNA_START=680 /DNA_END=997 /DNA_ORIENTATION=+